MTGDPILDRFAVHAQAVLALVASGDLDRHQALADLVADALAASCAEDIDPDTGAQLRMMAEAWAITRARGLTADALLVRSPVPDDIGDLDLGEPS